MESEVATDFDDASLDVIVPSCERDTEPTAFEDFSDGLAHRAILTPCTTKRRGISVDGLVSVLRDRPLLPDGLDPAHSLLRTQLLLLETIDEDHIVLSIPERQH